MRRVDFADRLRACGDLLQATAVCPQGLLDAMTHTFLRHLPSTGFSPRSSCAVSTAGKTYWAQLEGAENEVCHPAEEGDKQQSL